MGKFKSIITPIVLFIIVIFIWKGSWHYIDMNIIDVNERGTFGDKFGFINSLFSGLAFAGVIYAILLQRRELKLQREELRLTREELKLSRAEQAGQKEQLKAQNMTFRNQTLQNAFFQMLNFHSGIVQGIFFDGGINQYEGRVCFKKFYMTLFISKGSNKKLKERLLDHDFMIQKYMAVYSTYQDDLGHYFRNLYSIIKFIHVNDFNNKKHYTSLVRAQLSSYEMIFLFYNCEFGYGRKKFKPLVEKYSLLNNINKELLLHPKHEVLYDDNAYA